MSQHSEHTDHTEEYYDSTDYESSSVSSDRSDDSGASGETFHSIAAALEAMRERFETFHAGVEHVHETVNTMEPSVLQVAASGFVQPRHLESAPFRQQRFTITEAAKELLGFTRPTAKFRTLCQHLRAYCFRHGLVSIEGRIRLDDGLKTLTGFKEDETTFLNLLAQIHTFIE